MCPNDCPYLLPQYNVCINPKYKNHGKRLQKSGKNYISICGVNKPETDSKSKSKYNNKKITVDGMVFDSKKEYLRFRELSMLVEIGDISDLQRQVPYVLIDKSEYGRQIKYVADFVYKDKSGNLIVEDVKSKPTRTQLYLLKKRLLAERYGIKIKEYCN